MHIRARLLRRHSLVVAALLATLAVTSALVPMPAGAQGDPVEPDTTTTTTIDPNETTTTTETTVPTASTTTTSTPKEDKPTTTTTTVPSTIPVSPVTIPPELAADPRAPILFDPGPTDGGDLPVLQPVFDPGTNLVLEDKVAEIRAQLGKRMEVLGTVREDLVALKSQVAFVSEAMGELTEQSRANVAAAAKAENALRDHTIDAFMNGSTEDRIAMVRTGDPVRIGVARELLESVVDSDQALLERYDRARAKLDDRQLELVETMAQLQREYADTTKLFTETMRLTADDAQALRAYEAGAQVYVQGFVFPVQGEVEFIDSWGYPRMTGTASAHWHQGTDIFAPMGTPLVASESGVLDRVGIAGLGGMRLWIDGDSGTSYYYAHLIAFAEGMKDGVRVNAGDVVGYVGDTGNAKGTSPHVHFEVHPGGGEAAAVNPYPILKATYGSRPMVQIVQAPPPAEALEAPPG